MTRFSFLDRFLIVNELFKTTPRSNSANIYPFVYSTLGTNCVGFNTIQYNIIITNQRVFCSPRHGIYTYLLFKCPFHLVNVGYGFLLQTTLKRFSLYIYVLRFSHKVNLGFSQLRFPLMNNIE